ncbi:MAG TPA: DUF4157 domain-containing protein [Bryobacteraceae bacterium]|nr:DUF4157 domain-containing protein [Bryobacteraceae bacterium]
MKLLREESPHRHVERSQHNPPVHDRRSVPEGRAGRGTSLDRLGNRALLSQMRLQRKGNDRLSDGVQHDAKRGGAEVASQLHGGRRLDEHTRALMESRFGHNFSDVRIHTGQLAAETADSLRARAFAVGENIVFAGGQFAPETPAGQRILAHELAHVVQQRQTAGPIAGERDTERDAHDAAHNVISGAMPMVRERAQAGIAQKLERPPDEIARLDELKALDARAQNSTLSAEDEKRREELREELQRLDEERLGLTPSAPSVTIAPPRKRVQVPLDLPPGVLEMLKQQGSVVDEGGGPVFAGNIDPGLAAAAAEALKKGTSTRVVSSDVNFPFFPTLAPPQPVTQLFLGGRPLIPGLPTIPKAAPTAKPAPPPEDPEITLAKKRAREVTALAEEGSHEELVKYFQALDKHGFEQLQSQLGSRMAGILDTLTDFEAVYIGSLGGVKYGRDRLTEKREDYMLRIREYGSMQSQVFYAWMFSKMSNEEADALLKQLAADQRLKHTVLAPGTEQLQRILKARGIDVGTYEDRSWQATDIARGLFEGAASIVESGEDFKLGNTLNMYHEAEKLPPEYKKALDEGLSALFQEYWEFPEKHPFQAMGWGLDAMLLRVPSSTFGIAAGVGSGAYNLSEGHVDDAFRDFLPALIVLISHYGGKALGGVAASDELALLGPEYKGPAGRLPSSLPTGAAATGAWEEFLQTDPSGNVFKVVIDRSTGTGSATHVASGKMIFFENGKLVNGPVGLLPPATPTPPFDPFALGLPSATRPALPGANLQPFWLPSASGPTTLTLPPSGLPLLGPAVSLPLLPLPGPFKGLPPPPAPLVVRPGMTLKEMREAQVLKRIFPNSRLLEEKFGAYDGFEGGTEKLHYHVDEVKNGQPIISISRTISGAHMISLKELDPPGPGVRGTVEERLVQNVNGALEAAYQRTGQPIAGVRGQTPVTGTTDVYFRTTVENPSRISIVIQVPENSPAALKALDNLARQTVAGDTRLHEMPPVDVQVVPVQ